MEKETDLFVGLMYSIQATIPQTVVELVYSYLGLAWATSVFAVLKDGCPFVGPFDAIANHQDRMEEETLAPIARHHIIQVAKLANAFFKFTRTQFGWEFLPTKQ